MDWTLILVLGYVWVLFCGWAKERGHFGPEFWVAAVSPILMIVAFFIALLFNIVAPPSAATDPVLLLFYIYFLLPIPGMTWITGALGWRPRYHNASVGETPPTRTGEEVRVLVAPVKKEQCPALVDDRPTTALSTHKYVVLGKGRPTDIAFSQSGDMLVVGSPLGVYLYASDGLFSMSPLEADENIACVAVSTASGLVAAGDTRGRLHLWRFGQDDVWKTLKYPYIILGPARLAFSADGSMLAYGGEEGLWAWNVDTGNVLITYPHSQYQTRGLSFTKDGGFLIWECPGWPGECYVWNMVTRKRHLLPEGTVAAAFPNYALLRVSREPAASYRMADGEVQIRNLQTDQVLATLILKSLWLPPRQIALSPYGDRWALITSFGDEVWAKDVSTGRDLVRLRRNDWVRTTDTSPPWDLRLRYNDLGWGSAYSLAFSHDGRLLAIRCDSPDTVRIWDLDTVQMTLKLRGCYGMSTGFLDFSPNDRLLSSRPLFSGDAHLWNLQDGRELLLEMGHASPIRTIAFSPDGLTLACAGDYGEIQLWDVKTHDRLRAYKMECDIKALGYTTDGTLLAVREVEKIDGRVLDLWDVVRDRTAESVSGCEPLVLFAQTCGNDAVRLWNTLQGQVAAKCGLGVTSARLEPVVSADGTRLALAVHPDGTIDVFRIDPGNEIVAEMTLHSTRPGLALWSLAFSTDGRFLATVGDGPEVWLWDLHASGSEPRVFRSKEMTEGYAVGFSGDGRYLVSGGMTTVVRAGGLSKDGLVELWDLQTGQNIGSFAGHKQPVRCVALSSDGRLIASGSGDGTVRLWEVGLSEPVGQGPALSQH